MKDHLHLTKQGLVIEGCLAKVERYCRLYAFSEYDLVGLRYASETSLLRTELLDAMNSAMRARSSRIAWQPFLDKPLRELESVPVDIDLIHCTDEDYIVCRVALRGCYQRLTSQPRISDMAATKMLHLKRPNLVAISDSYVREALGVKRLNYTECGLAVADAVREIGKFNLEMLSDLQDQLLRSSPFCSISKVRLIDIIIWSHMTQIDYTINQPKAVAWTKVGANMKQLHIGTVDDRPTYHITLCQQHDRYVVAINGKSVMYDETLSVDDGKGALNVLCSENRRGWYYLKDVKSFCESHSQPS